MTSPTRPRVLVIAPSSFNLVSGTGVLLVNLFQGWPADALASIHGDPLPEDTSVCRHFFRVTTDELRWAWPFSLFQSGRSPEKAGEADGGLRLDTGTSALRSLLKSTVTAELPWRARLSPRLIEFVESFRPQVLYVLPGGPYMQLALLIAERWNVPVVTHMMDDWPSASISGALGWAVAAGLRADLRRLFERSTDSFAISDSMAEAYGGRYGRRFQVFQNPVDVAGRRSLSRTSWMAAKPFRIVYIGSILPQAQLTSLADTAKAVEALRKEGRDVRLDIFSAWSGAYPDKLRASDGVHLHAAAGEADLFGLLTSSDVLLLPINFDEASRRFIRHSMPAKIPIYLLSGTPILVYGPSEAAAVRYAEEAGWAMLVARRDVAELGIAIRKLMDDGAMREKLGRRAIETAVSRHDAAVVRERFQAALAGAVA